MASNLSGTNLRTMRALFTAGTVGGLTDGQLLERFTDRDADGAELAFAGLVERHGPMVLRVCRTVLGDAHLAEDAFQATFLILALKAGSIRGRESLTSWLYAVAYNVAATARSSAARRHSHELEAGRARPVAYTENVADELGPVIHDELNRIPERYRAVLVLCCLEGLTQQQAAQRLGWPLGTVQSRLARGRERLRARLARRGLAPAAAVLMLPLASEAARAAMPVALANATVRLALTIGPARALAIGVVPAGVVNLVKGVVRTMFLNKALTTGMAAILAAGIIATGALAYAYQSAKPDPVSTRPAEAAKRKLPGVASSDDGLLTVRGIVRLRDGSPVAGASVQSFTATDEASPVTHTDAAGQFQLKAVFGHGCDLHVSSADGSYQAVLKVPSVATRTVLSAPLELTLLPALHHDVTVLSDRRPVAGVLVAASGAAFRVQDITGQDGKVRLRLPAKERLSELAAWHPTLGANGKRNLESGPREGATELSLLPPAPQTIHVVDEDGHGIRGLELGVSAVTQDSDYILANHIQASHVRTDASGMAIVPWTPREKLQFVDVDLVDSDWKVDEIDMKRIETGMIIVHARHERAVQGRLMMPDGADAQGILVTGYGFGPGNNGDIPDARARRDGTFTLRVPSEHGYVLGIEDLEWACDPWSGLIIRKDSDKPAEITMKVYPATPLTVRVTRGPGREPVANAWVELSTKGDVNWTDTTGKKRSGTGGVRNWLRTDAAGAARAGVGKRKHELRLDSGDWNEERTVQVTSIKPVQVEFHRPWNGNQRISGRLTLNGAPYTPSPTLVARAWGPKTSDLFPPAFQPVVQNNGSFEVAFDAESTSLLVIDRNHRLSGFAQRVHGDAEIDVTMEPTATYSGTLVDDNARPVASRTVEMYATTSDYKPVAAEQTDNAGRFRFTGVPSKVPLRFRSRHEPADPNCYIDNGDRMFNPDEVRENDPLKLHRDDPESGKPQAAVPLTTSVENVCRNARATGMHALVALLGDDSGDTGRTIDQLSDDDDERMKPVLSYLTVRVDVAQLKKEATTVTKFGWPRPAPGEIVLVALDGDQKTIAAQRIVTKNVAAAVNTGADFLKQHRPPARNATTLLAEARSEAKRSGRRVWVIQGGPRCGPCFRLARWIEGHHETLDKDYVVVKLMGGVDEHVNEAIAGLPIKDGDGIPWFAFTEPDGTILAISRGPAGNIGFPTSVEGIRHFRQMLNRTVRMITSVEVDRLINSLSSVQ